MRREVISQARRLANEHWAFIEKLLNALGVNEDLISKYRFFYVEAFIHGFKHGVEWVYQYILSSLYHKP